MGKVEGRRGGGRTIKSEGEAKGDGIRGSRKGARDLEAREQERWESQRRRLALAVNSVQVGHVVPKVRI